MMKLLNKTNNSQEVLILIILFKDLVHNGFKSEKDGRIGYNDLAVQAGCTCAGDLVARVRFLPTYTAVEIA